MMELDGPRFGPHLAGPVRQLVVLCHGRSSDGDHMLTLAQECAHALPHAVFVAPNGPQAMPHASAGRQWFDVEDRRPAAVLDHIEQAAALLDAFIDGELARYALAAEDLALVGFSQGAMLALYSGLRRRSPPRGIVAFSGALIGAARLARRDDYPTVFIAHGERDETVPVAYSRKAAATLRGLGVAVESHFLPELGHDLGGPRKFMTAEFLQRIFADG
jgi:phospholipase/carboxylesterase